ncbi:MAG: DNA primase [Candidatus Omnitrophica bacterium]|nr:DNA primase [Candidatus Omnitrophota bacterium]
MERLIPQSKITEIIEKLDIYEVVSKYITLKKSGRNYKANCPFHEEKTPSFLVSPEKQIFHCFGCGAGGNVINFLMKIENTDFSEAVYNAANTAGIKLAYIPGITAGENKKRNDILEVNRLSVRFFSENLGQNKNSLEYLSSRGFSEESFKRFSFGYAPGGNSFLRYLDEKDAPYEKFISAGLILKSFSRDEPQSGKLTDYFRNRLIIPIFDIKDNVIGFGGRALDENVQPKYLNTAENDVFKKGQVLYGLNWAKESIKKQGFVIIVEGYFDLLKLHINGLENVVAPLGTALTDFHLKALKRWTEKILLVFDPDQAGSSATLRSLEPILRNGFDVKIVPIPMGFDPDQAGSSATLRSLEPILRNGFDVKIVPIPMGFDPDTFVDNYGINAFRNFINEAKDFVEYKIALGSQVYDTGSAKGKAKLAAEILRLIELIPDTIEQKIYVKKMSEMLNIEEKDLFDRIKSLKVNDPDREEKKPVKKVSSYNVAEKLLIEIILQEPGFYNNIINRKDILSENIKNFLEFSLQNRESGVKFSTFVSQFQEENTINFISQFAFASEEINKEKKEKIFNECVSVMSKTVYTKKIDELKKTIKHKEENQESIDLELNEIQTLYYRLRGGGV